MSPSPVAVLAAGVLAVFAGEASAALSFRLAGVAYLELDGRYYSVEPGTFSVDAATYSLQATTSMINCSRSNGASQVYTERSWRWNNGLRIIYLTTAPNPDGTSGVLLKPVGPVLRLRSATGDISCQGQVPPPDPLFASSFE